MRSVWCVYLTVRLLRLDWLSVHVSRSTTELLMRDPVWPAHVSVPPLTKLRPQALHPCVFIINHFSTPFHEKIPSGEPGEFYHVRTGGMVLRGRQHRYGDFVLHLGGKEKTATARNLRAGQNAYFIKFLIYVHVLICVYRFKSVDHALTIAGLAFYPRKNAKMKCEQSLSFVAFIAKEIV